MRTVAMCFAIAAAALVLGHGGQAGHDFVIDQAFPYAYLKFDHVGPRHPILPGEGRVGLWLRIVNNSRVTVVAETFGLDNGDPGAGVLYRILSAGRDNCAGGLAGLGISMELHSGTAIPPGGTLLFGVPREQVTNNQYLETRISLAVSGPRVGDAPFTQLDFFNSQIPPPQGKDEAERRRSSIPGKRAKQ